MKRTLYIVALIALTLITLFARNILSLFSATPTSADSLVATARVEFSGFVTRVMDTRGLIVAQGVAQLSEITAERAAALETALLDVAQFGDRQTRQEILAALGTTTPGATRRDTAVEQMEALLASQAWTAWVVVPFEPSDSGGIELAQQARIRIRVLRPNGVYHTFNGRVVNASAILTNYEAQIGLALEGIITTEPEANASSVEEYMGTIDAELMTEIEVSMPWDPGDLLVTIDAMDTQFPRTNTPEVKIPTSPPTVAGPNS